MKRILFLAFISIAFALPQEIDAQWKNIAPHLLYPNTGIAGEIIHYKDGVIWAAGRSFDLHISVDSGKAWTNSQISCPTCGSSSIYDISFYDKNIGAAVTSHGIYFTHDGGQTWNPWNLDPQPVYRISFNHSPLIIHAYGLLNFFTSLDGGYSWKIDTLNIGRGEGFSFTIAKDGTIFAIIRQFSLQNINSAWIYSSKDYGATWQKLPTIGLLNRTDSYSIDIDSCDSQRLYITNENYYEQWDKDSKLLYSSDLGSTWNEGFSHPLPYISGSLAVGQHSLYAQTISDGILRSTDQGVTWKNIGGPGNLRDSRSICVVNDNLLFAFDSTGNIWETTNSGGDSLPQSSHSVSIETADQNTDTIGVSSLRVPITILDLDAPRDVTLILHYDPDLEYHGSYSVTGIQLDIPGEQWQGRSKLFITNANDGAIAGYANFNVFSDSTNKSKVWFDSLNIVNTVLPCGLTIQNTIATSMITGASGCGDSIISAFMRTGKIPDFTIRPNPVTNNLQVKIINSKGDEYYELFDALGNTRKNGMTSDTSFQINISELPTGNYYLRISGSGGMPVTKGVLVLK